MIGLALASCGGKVNPSTVRVGGEKRTSAALAGSRCAPEGCTCRNLDAAADQAEKSPPAPGMKRFELRVGPTTQPTWVGVAGVGTLYRASDSGGGEVCCQSGCANLGSSGDNCGACGRPCSAGCQCSAGLCCPVGEHNSDGICCDAGQSNVGGRCCPSGNRLCGGHCCGGVCLFGACVG